MSREINSARLSLRPVAVDDVEALHALWTDTQVRRFLWDGEVIPLERTREIVERSRTLFDESRFGIWGIRERRADALLGFRNTASVRVLEKLGMLHQRRDVVDGLDTIFLTLTRDDWENAS